MLAMFALLAVAAAPPVVHVDRDNVEITASCTLLVDAAPIVDADGDGVIHVTAPGVTVRFEGPPLRGAVPGTRPDAFEGIGVAVTARDVTVRGARISGFKTAVYAQDAPGLVVEHCDLSGNFRQHLGSAPQAEDPGDWLVPHDNDDNEWMTRYGAALYVEDSDGVTVRHVRVRDGQNGIVLDRVDDSKVYDNDCSFLSGWGLAMWRSSRNVVSRNAFDFCVRGYSHGVYNRGQDSAGILMFEQCNRNTIAENSVTHCGDGLFMYAGDEALGKRDVHDDLSWYKRQGCTSNLIAHNDFSYAAAHGIEITFGFVNHVVGNRVVGNAICGLWGGYSQRSIIVDNTFKDNGGMPYGSERGGINIEHGYLNVIATNDFENNACGISLWWDEDTHLLELPWAAVNERGSDGTLVIENNFKNDDVGVQIRRSTRTTMLRNRFSGVRTPLDADEASHAGIIWHGEPAIARPGSMESKHVGETQPYGARDDLRGREHIIMTEWGPYDWEEPLLQLVERSERRHVYRLLGHEPLMFVSLDAAEEVDLERDDDAGTVTVSTESTGSVHPYVLTATTTAGVQRATAALVTVSWDVVVFASPADPRGDAQAWRRGADGGVSCGVAPLELRYGRGGPSQLDLDPAVAAADLPADGFGTIATATMTLPRGRWRFALTSDDGVRLWLDGDLVIDDWTWHPPRTHTWELTLDDPRQIDARIEHFELDGYAVLSLDLEPVF